MFQSSVAERDDKLLQNWKRKSFFDKREKKNRFLLPSLNSRWKFRKIRSVRDIRSCGGPVIPVLSVLRGVNNTASSLLGDQTFLCIVYLSFTCLLIIIIIRRTLLEPRVIARKGGANVQIKEQRKFLFNKLTVSGYS